MQHIGSVINAYFALIFNLPSKIIESDMLIWNTKVLSHFLYGFVHQRRTTEIQLDILGGFVLAQIIINNTVVYKANETVTGAIQSFPNFPIILR